MARKFFVGGNFKMYVGALPRHGSTVYKTPR